MGGSRSVEVLAKEAKAALSELAQRDLTELPAGEVTELVVLTSEVAKVAEAAHTAAVGRLDRSRAWEASGARGAAAWVAWQCHLSKARAGAAVRCARVLRDLPATEAAFLRGELTAEHVRLLAAAHRAAAEPFADDEERLVGLAGELLFSQFERVIRYWIHYHDPDRAEGDARSRYEQRRVDCSSTFENMVVLDALLDPMTGAIVARELQRLEQQLFEADWADARQRLGEHATAADLRRSLKQRRADALRLMAERSAAKPPGATEARVLIQVLAGHESVNRMCELSNGTVVTPGEVLPVLIKADVERVIFSGRSKVIDVGVRRRLFTGALRTAVELTHLTCAHASCDVPVEQCQIDHIVPYDDGGLTIQANGRPYCKYHHRRRHRRTPPAA